MQDLTKSRLHGHNLERALATHVEPKVEGLEGALVPRIDMSVRQRKKAVSRKLTLAREATARTRSTDSKEATSTALDIISERE